MVRVKNRMLVALGIGALAGILWLESAKRYGWSTTLTDFLKIGLFVTPVAILASSIVLAVEILLF